MVVFNTSLSCLSPITAPPFTIWTSLPTSPCPLLSPLPSMPSMPSLPSSQPCSQAASPTTPIPIPRPLSMSPYTLYGSSVVIKPTSWKQSYGMEQVWLSEFNRLFSNYYQQVWILQPVEHKPIGNNLHTFVDSAKVRFCCNKCGHGWTSMKGRVVFWFDLLSPFYSNGFVVFKLYGQQCDRCKADRYEQAMWYPEEVCKVLTNLYNRVGQLFFGFYQPPIEKTRRSGKPRTPHNSKLCQACKDGLCADRK